MNGTRAIQQRLAEQAGRLPGGFYYQITVNMSELTVHYSRCNFCFRWFEFACKFRCPLAVCSDCFSKAQSTESLRVASSQDRYIYRVIFVQTPQRCDEEELLLTQNDEYKKSAYEELDEAFLLQSKELIGRFRKCRRRLDYLEPDAPFEELKAAIASFKKGGSGESQTNSQSLGGLPGPLHRREDTQEEFESRLSQKSADKRLHTVGNGEIPSKPRANLDLTSRLTEARQSLCLANLERVSIEKGAATSSRSRRASEPSSAMKSKIGNILEKEERPASRLMIDRIFTAVQSTGNKGGSIQLVGHILDEVDFGSYLSVLDWKDISTVKLVKVRLTDTHFKWLISALKRNPQVQTLVLTNNQLTYLSLQALQDALENLQLKNLYIGNNSLYTPRAKQLVRQLRRTLNVYM